jgi:hypothetical protein
MEIKYTSSMSLVILSLAIVIELIGCGGGVDGGNIGDVVLFWRHLSA